MDVDRKVSLLKRALGPVRADKSFKGELLFTCPRCKHSKNKLCVDIETDRFHCWNCGYGHRSSIESLLWYLDDKQAVDEYKREHVGHVAAPKKFEKPTLPPEMFSLLSDRNSPNVSAARQFLRRRGVTDEKIALYKMMFAEDGYYRNRVVFPSFDRDGELNFFVGRAIYDGDIRYRHGVFDKDVVFNELMLDWTKPIVLTEGPFDALVGGTNAVPLQGKFLDPSSKLFAAIVKSRQDVYLALDSDARRFRLRAASLLTSFGIKCFDVPLLGKKDLGEMTEQEFKTALSRAKKLNDGVDVIRARLSCA